MRESEEQLPVVPLLVCETDIVLETLELRALFPSCRCQQDDLICAYRSDSVTRDWPVAFKSARLAQAETRRKGGWGALDGQVLVKVISLTFGGRVAAFCCKFYTVALPSTASGP